MGSIAVVDYGMGNLRSVARALEHVVPAGTRVNVTDCAERIIAADRVVFPGQGAARDCMRAIDEHELREPLLEAARARPFIGMCMGLQVLLAHSEENDGTDCLGLYRGEVRRFDARLQDPVSGARLKIPHMGWNGVRHVIDHPLWAGIDDGAPFYFVHSYHADPDSKDLVAGTTEYGHEFASVLAHENVFACQFHPEKSSRDGLRLLSNFAQWNP